MKTEQQIKTMMKIANKWFELDLPEKEKVKGFMAALEWVLED